MNLEGDYKRHSCVSCEKLFKSESALVRHEKVHTGEKPCRCDICYKYFARSDSLKSHQLTHSGLKIYQCDV